MAIVDLVQRSDAWLAWRKTGITASMIPVIMERSDYQTPYQLWAELVGLKEPDDLSNNYHVQRGVEQEPEARDTVENEYGKPYMPVCVEADHNTLFKASLDGLYSLGHDKEVLEIKCPCEKIYNEILAQKGQAPTFQMYAAQVQWQLNCATASQGRLYFYLRGKRPISTAIRRNDMFIAKAEEKALWFWNCVQTKTPPPMMDGRDTVVYDIPQPDNTWQARVAQYKEKSKRLSEMEKQTKAIKADLKQLEQFFTSQIPDNVKTFDKDGIRATRVERDGNIDYPKLLKAVEDEFNRVIPNDLKEKYRKEGSSHFRVTVTNTEGCQVVQNEPSTQSEPAHVEVEQPSLEIVPAAEAIGDILYPKSPSQPKNEEVKVEKVNTPPIQPVPPSNFFEKSSSNVFF